MARDDQTRKMRKAQAGDDKPNHLVTDPRFARLHSDPRFRKFPKDTHKVQIDARFKAMFDDDAFQGAKVVDKRGRKVAQRKKGQNLKHYYRLKDEEVDDAAEIDAQACTSGEAAEVEAAHQQPGGTAPVPKTPTAASKQRLLASSGQRANKSSQQAGSPDEQHKHRDDDGVRRSQGDAAVDAIAADAEDGMSSSSGSEDDAEEGAAADMTAEEFRWARARGLLEVSSSDSEDDSSSSGDGGSDGEEAASEDSADRRMNVQEWGVGAMAANPDEQVPAGSPTKRLALVDLDWRMISAVDILAALRSFCPSGGCVRSVTVYPSDYGLEQMAAEQAAGPQAVFRATSGQVQEPQQAARTTRAKHRGQAMSINMGSQRSHDDDDDDDESPAFLGSSSSDEEAVPEAVERGKQRSPLDHAGSSDADDDEDVRAALAEISGSDEAFSSEDAEEAQPAEGRRGIWQGLQEESDDEDDGQTEEERVLAARIRAYERSKLRWYYAVAVCDSARTASHLYDECDGLEFQRSCCKFDMRFVPDNMDLHSRQVRDVAKDVPATYEPPNFHSAALQHTKAKLTWDEDDVQRRRALSRKVAVDELKDDDFRAYLASESDSEAEGEEAAAAAERYKKLLAGSAVIKGQQHVDGKGEDEDPAGTDMPAQQHQAAGEKDKMMEMEVTFAPGLEQLGKKILEQRRDRKKQKEGETVWEAYMRRKREKRRLAREMGRAQPNDSSDSDGDAQDGSGPEGQAAPKGRTDDPFDDPFFNDDVAHGAAPMSDSEGEQDTPAAIQNSKQTVGRRQKGTKNAKDDSASAKRAAELELLLMDDNALTHMARTGNAAALALGSQDREGDAPSSKQKVSKSARAKAKKAAKKREREHGSDDEDIGATGVFAANLSDARFAAVLTSPEFALDPTDPRYKQAQGLAKQVKEQRTKHGKHVKRASLPSEDKQLLRSGKEQARREPKQKAVAHDPAIQAMVAKLKNKSKRLKA